MSVFFRGKGVITFQTFFVALQMFFFSGQRGSVELFLSTFCILSQFSFNTDKCVYQHFFNLKLNLIRDNSIKVSVIEVFSFFFQFFSDIVAC